MRNAPRKADTAASLAGSYILQFESLTEGVESGGNSVEVTKVDESTIAISNFIGDATVNATLDEDGFVVIAAGQAISATASIYALNEDLAMADEPVYQIADGDIEGLYDADEGVIYIITSYAAFNDETKQIEGLAYGESFALLTNGKLECTTSVDEVNVAYSVFIEQNGNLVYITNFGNHGQTVKVNLSFNGSFTIYCTDADNMLMWYDVEKDYYLWKFNGSRQGSTLLGNFEGNKMTFSDEGNKYGWTFRSTLAGFDLIRNYFMNTVVYYTTDDEFATPIAPAAMPANPTIDEVGDYEEEEEHSADISITVPATDNAYPAAPLDTRYLFYKIYTSNNGVEETLKFKVDGEETDLIPWAYESEDIRPRNINGRRYVTVMFNPWKTVERFGIQSIYTAGGEENVTDVNWGSFISRFIQLDAQGFSTYSGSNTLDFSKSDAKAFTLKVDGKVGRLTEVPKIPSRAGVLVYGEPGAGVNIPVGSGRVTLTNNDLVAAVNQTTVEANSVLVLGNVDGVEGFYNYTGTIIPAGKAYLNKTSETATGLTLVFEDDTDGIATIHQAEERGSGVTYNLNGQRITGSYKGVVIVNGKKYLNK